jgi:hypothetical protein
MLIQIIVITELFFYRRQYAAGQNFTVILCLDFHAVLREGQVHFMKNTPTL